MRCSTVSAPIWTPICAKWASAISPCPSACRPSERPSTGGRQPTILLWVRGRKPLAQALCRNILNGQDIENARRLALYVETAVACLAGLDEAVLQRGSWRFPAPAGVSVQQ